MKQNDKSISKSDGRSELVILRSSLKDKYLETSSMIKFQSKRRDKLRSHIEDMKLGLKKFSYDNYKFLGEDHYPFDSIEEKQNLFAVLEGAKKWANEEYFKEQKKISEASKKLVNIENEIKIMKEDIKAIDSYLSKINTQIRNLS